MGTQVSISEVNKALIRIKSAITAGRYQFINRKKNLESMAAAGLLPRHVVQQILSLSYKNYLHGPEQEKDSNFPDGELFIFGCVIDSFEFFIKLKLYQQSNGEWCTCLSFHFADRPNYYPYK